MCNSRLFSMQVDFWSTKQHKLLETFQCIWWLYNLICCFKKCRNDRDVSLIYKPEMCNSSLYISSKRASRLTGPTLPSPVWLLKRDVCGHQCKQLPFSSAIVHDLIRFWRCNFWTIHHSNSTFKSFRAVPGWRWPFSISGQSLWECLHKFFFYSRLTMQHRALNKIRQIVAGSWKLNWLFCYYCKRLPRKILLSAEFPLYLIQDAWTKQNGLVLLTCS